MKWFLRILFALLLVGGWVVAARSLHIIHSTDPATGQDRFGMIPKARWKFEQTYVDVRGWTPADLGAYAGLVRHLTSAGKADLLKHVAPKDYAGDLSAWLLENASEPPATTRDARS